LRTVVRGQVGVRRVKMAKGPPGMLRASAERSVNARQRQCSPSASTITNEQALENLERMTHARSLPLSLPLTAAMPVLSAALVPWRERLVRTIAVSRHAFA
jgi:hypothetical protein